MKILALESTAKAASAALLEDGRLVGEIYLNNGMTHSQTLLPMVRSLLDCSGWQMEQVNACAVAAGPGSFTGLRIGIAAAKGLAFPFGIPCAPVSTLEALAENVSDFTGIVCAVMDARCRQVYTARFRGGAGRLARLSPDEAISLEQLEKQLKIYGESILLVGDGAQLCYNTFKSSDQPDNAPSTPEILEEDRWKERLHIAKESRRYQRASSVAAVAWRRISQQLPGSLVELGALAPEYLRLPQAERELRARQAQQIQQAK